MLESGELPVTSTVVEALQCCLKAERDKNRHIVALRGHTSCAVFVGGDQRTMVVVFSSTDAQSAFRSLDLVSWKRKRGARVHRWACQRASELGSSDAFLEQLSRDRHLLFTGFGAGGIIASIVLASLNTSGAFEKRWMERVSFIGFGTPPLWNASFERLLHRMGRRVTFVDCAHDAVPALVEAAMALPPQPQQALCELLSRGDVSPVTPVLQETAVVVSRNEWCCGAAMLLSALVALVALVVSASLQPVTTENLIGVPLNDLCVPQILLVVLSVVGAVLVANNGAPQDATPLPKSSSPSSSRLPALIAEDAPAPVLPACGQWQRRRRWTFSGSIPPTDALIEFHQCVPLFDAATLASLSPQQVEDLLERTRVTVAAHAVEYYCRVLWPVMSPPPLRLHEQAFGTLEDPIARASPDWLLEGVCLRHIFEHRDATRDALLKCIAAFDDRRASDVEAAEALAHARAAAPGNKRGTEPHVAETQAAALPPSARRHATEPRAWLDEIEAYWSCCQVLTFLHSVHERLPTAQQLALVFDNPRRFMDELDPSQPTLQQLLNTRPRLRRPQPSELKAAEVSSAIDLLSSFRLVFWASMSEAVDRVTERHVRCAMLHSRQFLEPTWSDATFAHNRCLSFRTLGLRMPTEEEVHTPLMLLFLCAKRLSAWLQLKIVGSAPDTAMVVGKASADAHPPTHVRTRDVQHRYERYADAHCGVTRRLVDAEVSCDDGKLQAVGLLRRCVKEEPTLSVWGPRFAGKATLVSAVSGESSVVGRGGVAWWSAWGGHSSRIVCVQGLEMDGDGATRDLMFAVARVSGVCVVVVPCTRGAVCSSSTAQYFTLLQKSLEIRRGEWSRHRVVVVLNRFDELVWAADGNVHAALETGLSFRHMMLRLFPWVEECFVGTLMSGGRQRAAALRAVLSPLDVPEHHRGLSVSVRTVKDRSALASRYVIGKEGMRRILTSSLLQ